MFDAYWKPSLPRARGTGFLYTEQVDRTYIQPRLARTLFPLFEQLDAPWPGSAVSYFRILGVLFFVSWLLYGFWKGIVCANP